MWPAVGAIKVEAEAPFVLLINNKYSTTITQLQDIPIIFFIVYSLTYPCVFLPNGNRSASNDKDQVIIKGRAINRSNPAVVYRFHKRVLTN